MTATYSDQSGTYVCSMTREEYLAAREAEDEPIHFVQHERSKQVGE